MSLYNLILFILSFIFVSYSLIKQRAEMKAGYIFIFMFYGCLMLNCLNLSYLQSEKEALDLYVLLVGPFFFLIPIFFMDIPFRNNYSNGVIDVNIVFFSLLLIYIFLKLYVGSVVGWRINSLLDQSTLLESGDAYTIPGISGLVISLQWCLLMFSPYVKKKWIIIFIVAFCIFAVLHVKRGDIMRMLVFYLLYYIFISINKQRVSIIFKKILVFVVGILIFFSILGTIRQYYRSDTEYDFIVESSGSKINSPIFAWTYSYFALNYDVLKLYYNEESDYVPHTIINTFMGEKESNVVLSINGFNASTFLSSFYVDYKGYFFIELFFYGIFVGVLIMCAKRSKLKSIYIFICTIMFFSPFGNYFQSRAMIVAILLSLILSKIIYLKLDYVYRRL